MGPHSFTNQEPREISGAVDPIENEIHDFILKAYSGLSEHNKCYQDCGQISQMNITYRFEYCKGYHKEHSSECSSLVNMASHMAQEGIVKVSEIYRRQFPEAKYQSNISVIFKQGNLYVSELRPELHYKKLIHRRGKTMPGKDDIERKLDKQTLKSLCELAATESDRKLIQVAGT